jgi:DNA replication licensing factor MCM3
LISRITTAIDDFQHLGKTNTNNATTAAATGCPRVTISMAELRSFGLSEPLRIDPFRHLRALEDACRKIANEERPGYNDKISQHHHHPLPHLLKVALAGPVGAKPCSPRQLNATSLRHLVCVEGVATKVSTIKPKVVRSIHYCPNTKKHSPRDYVDATDPNLGLRATDAATGQPTADDRYINITSSVYPTKDKEGNPLETEYGLSVFKDHQTISLQEMPETAPMGQLPRAVELILDHDLVDRIKPGDRVQIVGVYRALAHTGSQSSSGIFRTAVLVNNVQILGRDVARLEFSQHDIGTIRTLSQAPNILDILGRSIAPSIHGHAIIKKALALQLLSGVEKNLENGTHLRGDINILMVGDPSTAKSQLLRSAMSIAPLAVSTTGKGSSGVGLTAAVTSDPETRERRLEAGAMVLADRGLVCVDEFDKMSENDRVAIHEAMEQQTVTIAKAGIHASLNARCSVLAAANPVYGQYDRRRRVQENIGLPDSLLSRFDLLFVVLDQMDPESDRRIAAHVIRGHRYRNDLLVMMTGHDSDYDDTDDEDGDPGSANTTTKVHSVWQRNRHADDDDDDANDGSSREDVLQHEFLRKYIHYAKTRIRPVLTHAARDYIATKYAEMRARQDDRTIPITARSLETVIRLATAHAKARLSTNVDIVDCQTAMDILSFALYHEQQQPSKTTTTNNSNREESKKRPIVSDPGEDDDDDDEASSLSEWKAASPRTRRQRRRIVRGEDDDDQPGEASSSLLQLQDRIWAILTEDDDDGVTDVTTLATKLGETVANIQTAMKELEQDGRIMVLSDGGGVTRI